MERTGDLMWFKKTGNSLHWRKKGGIEKDVS